MKKLSFLALTLAALAATALFLGPAQDAEAYIYEDPADRLYLCYNAGLEVDKDNDGVFELGWNQEAGDDYSTCQNVLTSMINTANANGWWWQNPTCTTYGSTQPCRSARY